MKEYWVNVYKYGNSLVYGAHIYNKNEAWLEGAKLQGVIYIYRIHVKMKSVKPKYEKYEKYANNYNLDN